MTWSSTTTFRELLATVDVEQVTVKACRHFWGKPSLKCSSLLLLVDLHLTLACNRPDMQSLPLNSPFAASTAAHACNTA